MINLLIISLICIFLGVNDGLYYRMAGKPERFTNLLPFWHVTSVVIYCLSCWAWRGDIVFLAQAAAIRFGLLDIAFNAAAGNPLGYIGTEAWTDKVTKKLFKNAIIKAVVMGFVLTASILIKCL